VFAQDLSKNAALQLVSKNSKNIGITLADIQNSLVSNAYKNKTSGTDLVYLQQSFKGLPVYNQIQTLAFKNGVLVSSAGVRIKGIEQKIANPSASPSVAAENAVRTAMQAKKIPLPAALSLTSNVNNRNMVFAKIPGITIENITADLMWAPFDNGKSLKLVWVIYLAPEKTSDTWQIKIDAQTNQVAEITDFTISCNFKHSNNHIHDEGCDFKANAAKIYADKKAKLENDPEIVNGATYRVIPFPAESPNHTGGAHALRTDPWTAAPGNATSLKWHSDGTNDYTYTRGNNVWAYQDRGVGQNTPTVAKSTASTTGPDPLTFNFTPNYSQSSILNSPAPNRDFNVTNLFYWNNVIHDIVYQYGFDEVSGNFQANNQGRGGLGNDFVRAEAQDASGSDNANFSNVPDGTNGRMQMYLWNKANKPAFTIVNAPASMAGNITSVESNFTLATGFPANNILAMVGPVTGDVVYYNDNAAATHDACVAPANSLTGKIALLNRGNCDFLVKVQNAQAAGAIAVIVINNVAGAPIVMGGANASAGILIPAVMVSDADGAALVAQVANGLNITLAPDMIDGDLDNGIVVHEFGHGISTRLTGGPSQPGCLGSAEQMGEGWSDYYSLMLTQDWANSNVNTGFTTPRGIGTFAAGQPVTGSGIRTQRYSTDFSINNLVFTSTITAQQHTRGELWAATLWDMTWNIIQQTNSITPNIYNANGTGGNVIALKLVTEGMKLQPCGPGFIDGRDAILQADQILYNGAHSCAIKEAFRRRGMGPLASQGSANLLNDQVPDFTVPLTLKLTQNASSAAEGQNIVYTHTVTSCGPISNYTLRDTLPANVTYVSGGTYDAGTRIVSFPVSIAGAGGTQTYSFTVSVNTGSYYAPTTYLNEPVATAAIPATLTQTSTTGTVWAGTTTQSHSAPASLLSPNSAVPSDQVLRTTTPIALGANQSALSFWHWYNTEKNYDGGVLEISTDGGTAWADLDGKMVLGYYNSKIASDAGTAITNRNAYSSNSNGFIKTDVNLSSYAGQSVLFRWRFVSDNGTGAVGWFVDDILVKNEAVVNMRSGLYNGSTMVTYTDTVTLIQATATCANAAITTQPANSNACTGGTASFTVAATGTNITYQWQVSTDAGTTWNNVASATNATLNLTGITAGMNNNRYRVIVSNTCPSTVTSAAATLSVVTATSITGQPAPVTVCTGANASFTVNATGTAITYQWQVSTDGGTTWNNVPSATAATLNLTAVTATMNNNRYRALLSDCAPAGLLSAAATLTVNAPVAITTQPVATNACAGNNASFTVVASGTTATYQWEVSTDGGTTWNNVPAATSATLNLTAVTVAMNNNRYRVVVSNSCPSTVTSAAVALTVGAPTAITTQPLPLTVCAGANASFTVVASGTAVTYQWQVSTDAGVTFTNITAATAATLNLTAVTTAMNNNRYRVLLSDCNPGGLTSTAVALTVNSPAAITTQPAATTICTGANATFTVVATGTGISYQWQLSTDGGTTWNNIAAATLASYQVSNATAAANGNQYRVIVSGTCIPASVTSSVATLSVNNSIVVTQQPQDVAVCAGANPGFSITAAGSGLTYQWQVSTNSGGTWTNVTGATTNTLALTSVQPAMNNNQYRVVLNGACASNVNSNVATLTVNSSVTITTQPANVAACVGTPAAFTVVATGTTITYQWQLSTDAATWNNIAGATSASYAIANPSVTQNGHRFRVIVSGVPCGSVTSNAASLSVNYAPGVVLAAAQYSTINPATPTGIYATVSPAGTYSYAWYRNGNLLPNATAASIPVNTDGFGTYYVVVSNAQGCSKTSNEVIIGDSASNLMFVYPNPNRGQFQVRYYSNTTNVEERTLVVYSSSGDRVYNAAYNVSGPYGMMMVSIPNAAVGTYFVYLLDSKGSRIAAGRVVIER
ncbi:MAG: hypothetical protein EOP51_13650, partial [Sphingobacteriales bacterium]